MRTIDDLELYGRGSATLAESWAAYADATTDGSVQRHPGVTAAVFPTGPERGVYNNALLRRDLTAPERSAAIASMEGAYAAAGVERFAAWVHESDEPLRAELERRRYTVDATTLAMGADLGLVTVARPRLELASIGWEDYVRIFELPDGLLALGDHSVYHLLVAQLDGRPVATAMSYDHDGDCGIYNVGTLEHARRRGLGTAITALQLHQAIERGCTTASLQATPMAERVYAAAGFRSLGRIVEYVPATR
jgi:ribosomal protein S18 acetylase RimI-like enzyme